MKIQGELTNGMVPKIYKYDDDMVLFVMEDLSKMKVMRKGLIIGEKYPLFAEQISTFLSKTLFYTSDLYLDPKVKKEQVKKIINPELCDITEVLVFTDPYYDAKSNDVNPELLPYLEKEFGETVNYLLKTIKDIWNKFENKFRELWDKDAHETIKTVEGYQDTYLRGLLQDSIGMGGCKTMRRCVGMAHVEDLDGIDDLSARAKAQTLALKLGEAMVVRRNELTNISDFINIVKDITTGEDA